MKTKEAPSWLETGKNLFNCYLNIAQCETGAMKLVAEDAKTSEYLSWPREGYEAQAAELEIKLVQLTEDSHKASILQIHSDDVIKVCKYIEKLAKQRNGIDDDYVMGSHLLTSLVEKVHVGGGFR